MEIFKFLEDSNFIKFYEIKEFFNVKESRYYKISIFFIDDSQLHAREYVDSNERNYAFHWQDKDQNLIVRWDNAPHHNHIKTFPHHIHTGETVSDSQPVKLEDVVLHIKSIILD
jgi:hypothetical protein